MIVVGFILVLSYCFVISIKITHLHDHAQWLEDQLHKSGVIKDDAFFGSRPEYTHFGYREDDDE